MKYYVILIMLIVCLIPISNVFAQDEISKTDYILDVNTENSKYIPGQVPVIFGTIYSVEYEPLTSKISISITNNDNGFVVYETSIIAKEGKFRHVGFSPEESGKYIINARVNGVDASTEIIFAEFYQTKFGKGVFATMISIIFLLILIGIIPKKLTVTGSEPIRFALLTLCSLIPIVTLIATDVQIGQDGIAGLVMQEVSNSNSSNIPNNIPLLSPDLIDTKHFKWVMHFGGNVYDNYQSGITVPIYILFFGMIGGYLRFLYKTQRGWFIQRAIYEIKRTHPKFSNKKLKKMAEDYFSMAEKIDTNPAIVKRIIFNNSMQDLSLIFLPPILAVASYFILLQGGLDAQEALPTFATVSFAIGLISNEIIAKLESFAQSTIGDKNEGSSEDEDEENDEEESNSTENSYLYWKQSVT